MDSGIGPVNRTCKFTPVSKMVEGDGRWDWTRLQFVFSENGLQRLGVTVPPNNNDEDDRLCWRWESRRCFSVKSAYSSEQNNQTVNDFLWKAAWRLKGPQRVSSAECLFRKGLDSISRGGVGIRWEVPKWEWIKVNTDAAVGTFVAAVAGVVRDNGTLAIGVFP
ncbi:hypothetical protein PVK06_028968 [Gossypium arboreum]|uniref:Uncharacterized protein n=1 Tax=Gossypium arboreum TaxID=29729 RepID=A0ABR0P5C1_GOSAR|nr:hypothetical protein PVK06_028968 [Gossypium arboreum]